MFKRVLIVGALALTGTAYAAETPADAKGAAAAQNPEPPKNSEPPAAVSKELLKFLAVKLNLSVSNMPPQMALAWQLKLADIPLTIRQTVQVGEKKVSFNLTDVTLAEALRTINIKTGCQYRIVKDEIRLAMPQEWSDIDAGKTDFDKLVAKEKPAPAATQK